VLKVKYFASILSVLYEKRDGSGSGAGSIPLTNGSGFLEAQKHADPADPDLQHCLK
jgi:hypothetical protein